MQESKEKILIIAEIYPFPFDTGGKLRTANILIQLSKYYDVDFACFSIEKVSAERIDEARRYCGSVKVFGEKAPSTLKKAANFLTPTSNAEFIVKSSEMQRYVNKLLRENNYRCILAERLYAFQYVENSRSSGRHDVPIIIDMHDIEREAMAYFGKISSNPLKKLHYSIETKKVIKLEKRAVEQSTAIATVSERDKEQYSEYFPEYKDKWISINNGIDMSNTILEPKCKRDKYTVIFVGSLRHPPNLHGLKWFVKNVWPSVYAKKGNAKFIIVGSGEISEEDKNEFFNASGVKFLGFVENLYPLLRKSTCLVVPLFSGSGTRLKILEAFSFELPVISTSIGAEGLPYTDGQSILIANDEEEMKNAIFRLLDDEDLQLRLSANSYEIVKEEYDWENIIKKLHLYIEAI